MSATSTDSTKEVVTSLPFHAFSNALRILRSTDKCELDASGLFDDSEWIAFRDNPGSFFIRASDAQAAAIWAVIQKRQPAELRAAGTEQLLAERAALIQYRAAHEAPGWKYPGDVFCGGHLSDAEVASKVRMLMRSDLDHEAVCVTARDRILVLSRALASARADLEEAKRQLAGIGA